MIFRSLGPANQRTRAWTRSAALAGTATMLAALLLARPRAWAAGTGENGMPIVHSYSFEDIGNVPRRSHLGFDRFGRIAVIHDTTCYVLNDNNWLNIAESEGEDRIPMSNIIQAADGNAYYGARGSWGRVATGPNGELHPIPFNPTNEPSWATTGIFAELLAGDEGVYFASWNGFAYWDFQRKASYTFNLPKIPKLFRVGHRTYISAAGSPLSYLDTKKPSIELANGTELDEVAVEYSAPLDETNSLVALTDGRVLVFDGRSLRPWRTSVPIPSGHILAIEHLADNKVAIAISGQGLFLFSSTGDLALALRSSAYANITALANREPGVLWVETENTIQKILYGSPVTSFGQEQGMPASWPMLISWGNQLLATSGGKLYHLLPTSPGEVAHFSLFAHQPPTSVRTAAACGPHLLIGGEEDAYAIEQDGTYRSVAAAAQLVHLVALDDTHCFAIGRKEVGLLEWRDGRWIDAVPRIPGIQSPSVVHRVGGSVWIEMGGDGVARLYRDGAVLKLDVIRNETWTKCRWVNIGVLGDVAVLTGLEEEPRRFFDEKTGSWRKFDDIQKLLDSAPQWIARVNRDENGVIWATHNQGLICFIPGAKGFHLDSYSFDLINDRYPLVQVLPGNDIWVTSEGSMYHVDSTHLTHSSAPPTPVLVSVLNSQRELLVHPILTGEQLKLPFTDDPLTFRFFSGTDAWRKAPNYEYRIGNTDAWRELDGSVLNFHGLREGNYPLQVRIASYPAAVAPFALNLIISPPWQRSSLAYICLGALVILAIVGMIKYIRFLERKRARRLELLVRERTQQLEAATIQLSEEARKAATLTERDRVANEIHDSVQQGLTGAILQLDTTMKLEVVAPEVRSRLGMVRNIVSYVRQEVQRTIWDVESPLLEGSALAEALHNFTKFMDSGEASIAVEVSGTPVTLRPTVNHNLLRIAQEATANAIRHAKATQITIALHYSKTAVSLEIRDNGIGFVSEEILQKAGHLGLRGMKVRVKRLGGQFSIDSTPTGGTSIRAVISTHDPKPNIA